METSTSTLDGLVASTLYAVSQQNRYNHFGERQVSPVASLGSIGMQTTKQHGPALEISVKYDYTGYYSADAFADSLARVIPQGVPYKVIVVDGSGSVTSESVPHHRIA